jgi:nucleoside-diphosphate-sugar epimerase
MKILLIGGTGFIGSRLTHILAEQGHRITIYHGNRSHPPLPDSVEHVLGERSQISQHEQELRRFAPEVVIDCTLSNGNQARAVMNLFSGAAARIVALSSADVYRAAGILHGFESGPLQPTPLTEDSDLRTKQNVYGPELLTGLRQVFPWLDEGYDKIPVEQAVLGDPELPGTVLRLPMVYGPGDPLHRLFPYLKRMDDNRPAILLQEDVAAWRGPRGYVENVAAAVALATVSRQRAGRIYNIAEPCAWSEEEWVKKIAENVRWTGRIVKFPKELMPTHLQVPYRNEQHWEISSRRIRDELGFSEPVPEPIALARTIEWERSHPPDLVGQQFDYVAEDEALATLAH